MQTAKPTATLGPLRPDRIRLCSGAQVDTVAFYCPGTGLTPCDERTGGGPLANFWPLVPASMEVTHAGASGRFTNSEAAYQALKWWTDAPTRARFEACSAAGLRGGEDAFQLKRAIERREQRPPDAERLDTWNAMLLVLRAKWQLPAFRELLVGSAGVLLVEHCPRVRVATTNLSPVWLPSCVSAACARARHNISFPSPLDARRAAECARVPSCVHRLGATHFGPTTIRAAGRIGWAPL